MFVIDIAVPRDVDPEVARHSPTCASPTSTPSRDWSRKNIERRREAIPDVEEIIAEHVEHFGHWYQSRFAVPVVASLVHKAEAIRESELERLFARCPDLTERERMLITGASLTIVSKLLHGVVTKVRERATSDRTEALSLARMLNDLFDLQSPSRERPRSASKLRIGGNVRKRKSSGINASGMIRPGLVSLVGAGPGDPGLLTLKAARALAACDVLVYDYLASEPIVALASPRCEKIYVGKKAGAHTFTQDEITALIVRLGLEGKRVVRLKGGDVFVFARGGEEAQALHAADIPFEIVPGITSAIAVPAYAGIPITHRDHNTSFTIATGHEDPTKGYTSLDFAKLSANPSQTLVFLMAMGNLHGIVGKLLENGMAGEYAYGYRTRRNKTATRNARRHAGHDRSGSRTHEFSAAPAIVIIGNVVRERESIRWFDKHPLFGKRVAYHAPRGSGSGNPLPNFGN